MLDLYHDKGMLDIKWKMDNWTLKTQQIKKYYLFYFYLFYLFIARKQMNTQYNKEKKRIR